MLSSLRNFVITFLIALLIFGPASYFLSDLLIECVGPGFGLDVGESTPSTEPPATNDPSNIKDPVSTNGTSFNMLIVGTDYQPDVLSDYRFDAFANYPLFNNAAGLDPTATLQDYATYRAINADTILLLRADKAHKQFVYSYIPSEMLVTCGGVEMTLSEAYTTLGIEYLVDKVTAITGFYIDFYTVIDMTGVESLIDELGGVTVNVPQDMHYSDPVQNLYINLKAGAQHLNGNNCLDLLRYNGYGQSPYINRGTVTLSVINSLADAIAKKPTLSIIEAVYQAAKENATTTFGLSDLREHFDLITAYSSYTKHSISYPGEYRLHGGRMMFIPDTNSAILTYSNYR